MKTLLQQANNLMREDNYYDALELYKEFAILHPQLKNSIKANIQIAEKRIKSIESYKGKANSPLLLENSKNVGVLNILPYGIDSKLGYQILAYCQALNSAGVESIVVVPDDCYSDIKNCSWINSAYKLIITTYASFLNNLSLYIVKEKCAKFVIHAWSTNTDVLSTVNRINDVYNFPSIVHLNVIEQVALKDSLNKPDKENCVIENMPSSLSGITISSPVFEELADIKASYSCIQPLADERLFYPRPRNEVIRKKLNISKENTVIVYPGDISNKEEYGYQQLVFAIEALNKQGIPTTLIRTGKDKTASNMSSSFQKYLGWIKRVKMPELLAAADIFVQPELSKKNEQEIPVKLVEFFAMGRPVIVPYSMFGKTIEHGRHAFVLNNFDAESIASAVSNIISDNELKERLSIESTVFFREILSHDPVKTLLPFYQKILKAC